MHRTTVAAVAAALAMAGAAAAPAAANPALCVATSCTPLPVEHSTLSTVISPTSTPCTLVRGRGVVPLAGSEVAACRMEGSEFGPQRTAYAEGTGAADAEASWTTYSGCQTFDRVLVRTGSTTLVKLEASSSCT